METQNLFREIDNLQTDMVHALMELIRIPAIAPENGGTGELEKAERLTKILQEIGFDKIERLDADDPRVPSGRRPNIIAYCKGNPEAKKLWIVTHLDIVPPGEASLWTTTKPYEPILKEDRVYGRGSEDNGQPLVASVFAAKALKRLGAKLKRTFGLAIVADEEQGSIFGIRHLIEKGVFKKDDLVIVPDGGSSEGNFIEVVEKSILWFKIKTIGKQTHGSLPNKGLNANRIAMQFALALDERLHKKYYLSDDYFDVPISTFEPTKRESNVEAVNIVPGEDVTYFDCRILPRYDVEEVLADIQDILEAFERKTGASITIEILQKQVAPKLIDGNPEVASLLKKALKEARGLDAYVGGLGGGTCAAFFRKVGIPAVVWSTIDEVAHQHNEYSKVKAMVADSKVFALLAIV